jgi:TldD protein
VIDRDLAREVLETVLSRGGDSAQLYLERTTGTMLRLDAGRLEEASCGVDQGAGLSLVEGERTLYANGNKVDRESLLRMAERLARSHAAAPGGGAQPAAPASPRLVVFKERPLALISVVLVSPASVPMETKVRILQRADAAGRAFDPRVVQVTALYKDTEQRVLVADTDGTWASEIRQYITLFVTAVARQGEDMRTGTESRSETRGFEFFNVHLPEDVAREAARLAVQQLTARPAPAGSFMVVLSSRAGGTMVHEACGHGLEADFIQKSLSVYAGRVGQKVASPLITVVDDGTLPNLRGSSSVDDEGISTSRAVLIDKGVLRGFLHSRRTARMMGSTPTGHGRRESYQHLPLPRMRNTIILPGETPPEQILASVRNGILICRMGGGEVDVATGNFVFNCSEAYVIRDGKIAEPIRDATLIGNGPEILSTIDMVGTDLGYGVGTCGKEGQGVPVADAQPTLRIPKVTVGGVAT